MLTLRNVVDRVVSAALARTLAVGESMICSCRCPTAFVLDAVSPAPRDGHGVQDMLATILWYAAIDGRRVLAVDDVRGAFDNVVLADVVDDFARYVAEQAAAGRAGGRPRLWGRPGAEDATSGHPGPFPRASAGQTPRPRQNLSRETADARSTNEVRRATRATHPTPADRLHARHSQLAGR